MKKTFLTCLLVLSILTTTAQVNNITTRWCKLLDAAPPDMGCRLLKHDNALYCLSSMGTTVGSGDSGFPKEYTDTTASVYYDGTRVATGARYEGASYNNNFNLLKTDLDGSMQWCIYSTSGDMASNNGGIASAPDGGVYVSFVMRQTDNLRTEPLRFVDAIGQETIIDWRLDTPDSKRWWQGFIMKVSCEGAIDWIRTISVSHAPQPGSTGENATHTGSAFYIYDMLSDAIGNIYLTGRYCNPVTFDQSNGTVTLIPHNTDGWTGDSQDSRGDLYLAKFDTDGYLVKTLTTTGVALVETSTSLAHCDDGLILSASVTGAPGGSTIGLCSHEIALTEQASLLTVCLDTDFEVSWLQLFRGDKCGGRNSVIQNNRVHVNDDALWITGQANFTLYNEDETQSIVTQNGNVREGFVIKCDKQSGRWLNGACSKQGPMASLNGICGYQGGFENEDGRKFYCYGYSFASRVVETEDDITVEGYGVILVEHDAETLEVTDFTSLIGGGSMSTAQDLVATGNELLTLSRGTNKNTAEWALKPIGTDWCLETREWAVLLSAFELPFAVKDSSSPTLGKRGDVNGDGTVDVADVNLVINIMLGKTSTNVLGDINHDDNIDVADVNLVINIMLGKS